MVRYFLVPLELYLLLISCSQLSVCTGASPSPPELLRPAGSSSSLPEFQTLSHGSHSRPRWVCPAWGLTWHQLISSGWRKGCVWALLSARSSEHWQLLRVRPRPGVRGAISGTLLATQKQQKDAFELVCWHCQVSELHPSFLWSVSIPYVFLTFFQRLLVMADCIICDFFGCL